MVFGFFEHNFSFLSEIMKKATPIVWWAYFAYFLGGTSSLHKNFEIFLGFRSIASAFEIAIAEINDPAALLLGIF